MGGGGQNWDLLGALVGRAESVCRVGGQTRSTAAGVVGIWSDFIKNNLSKKNNNNLRNTMAGLTALGQVTCKDAENTSCPWVFTY